MTLELLEVLIKAGEDVLQVDFQGRNVVWWACRNNVGNANAPLLKVI